MPPRDSAREIVRRLRGLQEDVERLRAGENEQDEIRYIRNSSEDVTATETTSTSVQEAAEIGRWDSDNWDGETTWG